ncbi:Olfactory Receptor 2T3 [Manis pentadactyla]|nr:Olfactory Receptor 2T3 [Manis pentadactyla]
MNPGDQAFQNQTAKADLVLVGLFGETKRATFLYVVTFIFFLQALAWNTLPIVLILVQPCMHAPMYFFISQFSLMDLMYISVTVPKMLMGHVAGDRAISPSCCGVQMFFYLTLAGAECFPLAAMASDQYTAICRPLHYPLLMSQRSRKILSFFCEAPALLKLSCTDISLYRTFMYMCCVLMLLVPVVVISSSYAPILCLIHRMNSAEGWRKAFATCSSHMILGLFFFGTAIYTYMLPTSYHMAEKDMMVSAFYTIITPVLNPLIYSFHNKDVTGALRSTMQLGLSLRKAGNRRA